MGKKSKLRAHRRAQNSQISLQQGRLKQRLPNDIWLCDWGVNVVYGLCADLEDCVDAIANYALFEHKEKLDLLPQSFLQLNADVLDAEYRDCLNKIYGAARMKGEETGKYWSIRRLDSLYEIPQAGLGIISESVNLVHPDIPTRDALGREVEYFTSTAFGLSRLGIPKSNWEKIAAKGGTSLPIGAGEEEQASITQLAGWLDTHPSLKIVICECPLRSAMWMQSGYLSIYPTGILQLLTPRIGDNGRYLGTVMSPNLVRILQSGRPLYFCLDKPESPFLIKFLHHFSGLIYSAGFRNEIKLINWETNHKTVNDLYKEQGADGLENALINAIPLSTLQKYESIYNLG